MAQIDRLLQMMGKADASDLHLKSGMRPRFRVLGELVEIPGADPMGRDEVDRITREILSEEQERWYHDAGEIDFAYGDVKFGRYRCNYFQEYWGPAAVSARRIVSRSRISPIRSMSGSSRSAARSPEGKSVMS